jgi:putative sugar O-methyltransferase
MVINKIRNKIDLIILRIEKILKKKKKFKDYWIKNKNSSNFNNEIRQITEDFINSKSYELVSNQWHILNIKDYETINKNGLTNYGLEISTHYFTFLDYKNEYLENLFSNIKNNINFNYNVSIFKKHKNLDYKTSLTYNLLVLLMYENLKNSKNFSNLDKLSDMTYCDFEHPFIDIDGYKISSDKIVTLFDYDKISNFYKIENNSKILEIGAGSGRLSDCLISINNTLNYTICDIPPAIYISYKRMKLRFPNKKIKLLTNIDKTEDIIDEIKKNDISFIFPHQIELIDKVYFDLTLAVDCLHEMDKKVITFYFNNLNSITKNLYFSIWKKTKNWESGGLFKKTEVLDFDNNDYNVPKNWKLILKENLKFPSNQICLGYKIN